MFRSSAASPTVRCLIGLSAVLAASVSLAACGGSSTKSLSAPSVKPVASTSESSSAAPSAAPNGSVVTSAPAVTGAPAAGGSDPDSSFCQLAKSFIASSTKDESAFTTDSPAQLKAFVATAQTEINEFAAAAPASIAAATKNVVTLDQQIFAALKAANYSFTAASPAIAKISNISGLEADSTQITNYLTKTCGIANPANGAVASASAAAASAEASASAAVASLEASASATTGG